MSCSSEPMVFSAPDVTSFDLRAAVVAAHRHIAGIHVKFTNLRVFPILSHAMYLENKVIDFSKSACLSKSYSLDFLMISPLFVI